MMLASIFTTSGSATNSYSDSVEHSERGDDGKDIS